jgi:hypothetical protein
MIILSLALAIGMVLTACGFTAPKATPTSTVTQTFVPTQTPVSTPTTIPMSDTDYRSGGYPVVPLFARPNFLATNPNLQSVALNPTEYFTWNVETWTLQKK